MNKVYVVEERVSEYLFNSWGESEDFYVFETLEKAQTWVGERVSMICTEGHYDVEQINIDETYECGVIDIGDYQFIIMEREVK